MQGRQGGAAVLAACGFSRNAFLEAFRAGARLTVHTNEKSHEREDDEEEDHGANDEERKKGVDEEAVLKFRAQDHEVEFVRTSGADHANEGCNKRCNERIHQVFQGASDHDGDRQVDHIAAKDKVAKFCD